MHNCYQFVLQEDGRRIFLTRHIGKDANNNYSMFSEKQSLVLGWAGMMGIIVMCYHLE